MKIKKLILCGITFLLLSNANLFADLYEGFDFTGKKELSLGKEGAYGGETSSGWMSAWQIGSGDAVVSKKDIQFEGLSSTGGSVVLKGQRKKPKLFC
jgi:hypothetical protein